MMMMMIIKITINKIKKKWEINNKQNKEITTII